MGCTTVVAPDSVQLKGDLLWSAQKEDGVIEVAPLSALKINSGVEEISWRHMASERDICRALTKGAGHTFETQRNALIEGGYRRRNAEKYAGRNCFCVVT